MRVLFVAWRDLVHPQAGGSEVLVDRVATELQGRGHTVALLCGRPVGCHLYQVVESGGTYSQYMWAPVRYWRYFRGWDLVVDVENGIPFFSPLWRRGKVVCLVHHVHGEQWRQRFAPSVARAGWFLERVVMPFVYRRKLFLAVSESTTESLVGLGIPKDHIRVITNGVDLPEGEPPKEANAPLFVSVGRLVPHKRLDVLLRVWDRVRPHVGGRLVIVGSGPEEERLRSTAGSDVEFTGHLTEHMKLDLMGRAWLLVHTAQHEGWGVVIIEAAAFSTPALAFDVPGVRDAVIDGQTGVLVRTEDEMVAAWVNLAADTTRRHGLGRVARERAATFEWSRTVAQILAAADEVASGSAPAPLRR